MHGAKVYPDEAAYSVTFLQNIRLLYSVAKTSYVVLCIILAVVVLCIQFRRYPGTWASIAISISVCVCVCVCVCVSVIIIASVQGNLAKDHIADLPSR